MDTLPRPSESTAQSTARPRRGLLHACASQLVHIALQTSPAVPFAAPSSQTSPPLTTPSLQKVQSARHGSPGGSQVSGDVTNPSPQTGGTVATAAGRSRGRVKRTSHAAASARVFQPASLVPIIGLPSPPGQCTSRGIDVAPPRAAAG